MSEKSAFITGRNAFIGAVVALAFNPISLVIGYHLSKALSRPRIKIEFVKPIIGYKEIALSQDVLADIMANKDAFDKVKAQWLMASTRSDAGLIHNLYQWGQLLKSTKISYDFIELALSHESDVLSEYDARIKVLTDNREVVSRQDVLNTSVLRTVSGFDFQRLEEVANVGDAKAACAVLERWAAGLSQERDGLARIFASFRKLMEGGRERSGEVTFEVGVLNLGDIEGVVYPEGEFSTGGRNFRIAEEWDRYVVVKPHSFSKCTFKVKKEEIGGKDLDYLSAVIVKCMPETYRLTIQTPNGSHSAREVLPVTNTPSKVSSLFD